MRSAYGKARGLALRLSAGDRNAMVVPRDRFNEHPNSNH